MKNIDLNTQVSLMYNDTINCIADAKKKLFDVTRWTVTLNSGVLGIFFSIHTMYSNYLLLIPILIGIFGLMLEYSINYELNVHRKTLALLRKK